MILRLAILLSFVALTFHGAELAAEKARLAELTSKMETAIQGERAAKQRARALDAQKKELAAKPDADAAELAAVEKDLKEAKHQEWKLKHEGRRLKKQVQQTTWQVKAIEAFPKLAPRLKSVPPKKPRTLLVYSRTTGFRHSSIPMSVDVMKMLGKSTGAFTVEATEDPSIFAGNLDRFDGILMMSTTGNPIESKHYDNFEAFLKKDKGLIGIHAATDCHKNWPTYLSAMGGLFDGHPWTAGDTITILNEEPNHPICNHLESGWTIKDEIYQFKDNEYFNRRNLRMLLSLDLNGPGMKKGGMKRKDKDYAVSWVRTYENTRVFYSNLGHNETTFLNADALQHFLNGIQFALGDLEADARPSAEVCRATSPNFTP